jgi:hypothetical protein
MPAANSWSFLTMITAGVCVEFSLMIGAFFAWRQLVVKTRFLLWRMLLEKYPPRPDFCVTVLPETLDSFIMEDILVNSQSTRIDRCSLVIGEKGVHLANGNEVKCAPGSLLKKKYAFIPWCRLQTQGDPTRLEVLGTGDHLVFRFDQEDLMCFNPLWKKPRRAHPPFGLGRVEAVKKVHDYEFLGPLGGPQEAVHMHVSQTGSQIFKREGKTALPGGTPQPG